MTRTHLALLLGLVILLWHTAIAGKATVKIIASTPQGLSLKVASGEYQMTEIAETGTRYLQFTDPAVGKLTQAGLPELPVESFLTGVPPFSDVAVEIEHPQFVTIAGQMIYPAPSFEFGKDSTEPIKAVHIPSYDQLGNSFYPSSLVEVVDVAFLRCQRIARIHYYPYQYNPATRELRKCISVQINIGFKENESLRSNFIATPFDEDPCFENIYRRSLLNYSVAQQWRVQLAPQSRQSGIDSTRDWFRVDQPYCKISVGMDGIHTVTAADLQNIGVNTASIDPKTFKMFCRGVQIPILVKGESDGHFDVNDPTCGIEFFGTRNYDTLNHLNRYSDTTVYWLTWGGELGKRFAVQPTPPISSVPSSSFSATLHLEENVEYYPGSGDIVLQNQTEYVKGEGWYWLRIQNGQTKSFTFSLDNRVTEGTPEYKLRLRFQGSTAHQTSPDHKLQLILNGTVIGQVYFDGYDDTIAVLSIRADKFLDGENTLQIQSLSASSEETYFDWMEIEYPRKFIAVNDSLLFEIQGSASPRVEAFTITGFTDSLISVYRPTTPQKLIRGIVTAIGSQFAVSFQDTVRNGDTFIVVTDAAKKRPGFMMKKSFADIRVNPTGADYITVTHKLFKEQAQRLAQDRQAHDKLRTAVVEVDDIYDEFNYGFFSPEPIREFLRYAYQNWKRPAPAHLLLLGDANWDYKYHRGSLRPNYVPAYGYPASDSWYVMFGTPQNLLPQMFVGRLSCNSKEQAEVIVNKALSYDNYQSLSAFNKRFMMVTTAGGFDTLETQRFIWEAEDIFQRYVIPAPMAGVPVRIYQSDLQSLERAQQIQDAIADGAVWISFIGHAGTNTWANGINDPAQLRNRFGEAYLVSDFSCSTVRFAEPDVDCFAEVFTREKDGGAIAYIGESGFGFTNALSLLREGMYRGIVHDTVRAFAEALFESKLNLWQQYGQNPQNLILRESIEQYELLGDPAQRIHIARLPDLAVSSENVAVSNLRPSDLDDSLSVTAQISNFGLVSKDSVIVVATDTYKSVSSELLRKKMMVLNSDSISFSLSTFRKPGTHTITIQLDPMNEIAEASKTNNTASVDVFVFSNRISIVKPLPSTLVPTAELVVLNPSFPPSANSRLWFETDTTETFDSPGKLTYDNVSLGKVVTRLSLPALHKDVSYYWQARLVSSVERSDWINSTFTVQSPVPSTTWLQRSKNAFRQNQNWNISVGNQVRIEKRELPVKIISGANCSGFRVSVLLDSVDVLTGSTLWGYNFAVIDETTGNLIQLYITGPLFQNPTEEGQQMFDFVKSFPEGTYFCGGLHDDGSVGRTDKFNQAMELIGSKYIRQVGFRDSWAIIGQKGAPIGTVVEGYKKSPGILPDYSCDPNGPDSLKTPIILYDTLQIKPRAGRMVTLPIGPASAWKTLSVDVDTSAPGTSFAVDVVAIRKSGVQDTLRNIFLRSPNNLAFISAQVYPKIQLVGNFSSTDGNNSPIFRGWSVEYTPPPELAINYQVVKASADSVLEGENIAFSTDVYNVGFIPADSVKVNFAVTDADSGRRVFYSTAIPRIEADSFRTVIAQLNTSGERGGQAFFVEIDPEDKITELYETNNFYTLPFYVRKDTIRPVMDVTFDGVQVFDGDFVSARPEIAVQVRDNSPLPVNDTSDVRLALDGKPVYYALNPAIRFLEPSGDVKARVTYKPELSDGEHTLQINAKDASGNYVDTVAYQISFRVSNESKLLNVYNYPNPFSQETYFTFILTGSNLPDEMTVKIYTVAGRLIRDIAVPISQLRLGFNRIYWDGRDQDGDVLANGVYLYKMIIKNGDKTETAVQKLAVMK